MNLMTHGKDHYLMLMESTCDQTYAPDSTVNR